MDIRQLRYFLKIAEEKHITSAAKALNISQPPLSSQLKLLEEELGVTLFVRSRDSMELTPEGRVLQQHAQRIVGNFNAAVKALNSIRDGISGVLNIGAIGSAALDYLPRSISRFLQTSPGAEFKIHEASSVTILNLLKADIVELGIIKGPFDRGKYDHLPIGSGRPAPPECTGCYIALGLEKWFDTDADDIGLDGLVNLPLIVHGIDEAEITAAGFTPRIICTDQNIMTSITWALHGLGVAVVPYSSAPLAGSFKHEETLVRKRLTGLVSASDTVLIWKKHQQLSNIARKYIDMLCTPEESGVTPGA